MGITLRTVADTAPVGREVKLAATTDGSDTQFIWSANPSAGVTFSQNPSSLSGLGATETTITVAPGSAGEIRITVKGNVDTKGTTPHAIEFIEYSQPAIGLNTDQILVLPGNTNDAAHSPLYTATVKSARSTLVPGAEVRWSFEPEIAATVYDGNIVVAPVLTSTTWYPTKTDATTGETSIRIATDNIVELTVTATTLGVHDFGVKSACYATLDENALEYKRLPQLGPGPYSDDPVDLDEGSDFEVMIPADLTPPPGGFSPYEGYLVLDGNTEHMIKTWHDMSDAIGTVVKVPNAYANQYTTNTLGLFIQNRSTAEVYTYYPFKFTTIGHYTAQPNPNVSRNANWYPQVVDRNPGGIINNSYVRDHGGIPLTVTFDPGAIYDDGSWYIYFEWFLNNADLSKTAYQESPQSVALTALQIKPGLNTYTDTLPRTLASGYNGLGTLYVDFYLGKSPDFNSERVYSDWYRQGYVLTTGQA